MLVDHLLLPVSHKDDHEAVKSRNDPPELEAIHQKQRHGNLVPADLLENGVGIGVPGGGGLPAPGITEVEIEILRRISSGS